jgi:hypothetical protein
MKKFCKDNFISVIHLFLILGKGVNFFRTFGLYSSSLVLICLSLDRYYAVIHPLKVVDAYRRVNTLLVAAWILAAVLSLPQVRPLGIYPFQYTNLLQMNNYNQLYITAINLFNRVYTSSIEIPY